MEKLDAKTRAIGTLLAQDFFFRVPEYQRPFSWETDNFDDLIDDIVSANKDQEYFLGTIVLHHREHEGHFDVVDGQQRLTSVMILLACLRDLVEEQEYKSGIQAKILQQKNSTAAWLRDLINEGLIAPGYVDERSITDIKPSDLRGFTQCHFFAGIGGWSLALRLAGWPDDRPVWTGSCPCQSFSDAGARRGFDDPRHLWPEFFRLISGCRPSQVFGEQVEAAVDLGGVVDDKEHSWLDLVSRNLGEAGYEVGSAVFPAVYVGAPHLRERLYFVADSGGVKRQQTCEPLGHVSVDGFWADYEWRRCRGGKRRPAKPGVSPLAHGIPGQVDLLRGAGNAIVPQQAAEFIMAFVEATSG
jgi:DNA (cytosine-5)-methyltransferase 1